MDGWVLAKCHRAVNSCVEFSVSGFDAISMCTFLPVCSKFFYLIGGLKTKVEASKYSTLFSVNLLMLFTNWPLIFFAVTASINMTILCV